MKRMGARNAGNPHVACDVEGAGDVAWSGRPRPARQSSTLLMSGDGKRGNASPRPSSTLQIKGIKRHILVDTVGLLLHAVVHPADVQDRDGGVLLLSTLFGLYPFLAKLFADAGYQGPQFATAVAEVLPYLSVEIVKRSDQAKGFVVLPMRWVVERTLAGLNRCRRLPRTSRTSAAMPWHSSSLHQSA